MKKWNKYISLLLSLGMGLCLGAISHYYITKPKLVIAFNEGRKYVNCQCLDVVEKTVVGLGINLGKSVKKYCVGWKSLPKKYNLEE